MTDAIKKLREPAALGAAAYAALSILASAIELLFTSGGSFSDTAAGQLGNLLDFPVALAIAIAVYLANHVDPVLPKARLITLVALGTSAVAAVFGVVAFFASFGADVSGTDKFAFFLSGAGGAAAIGVAGWYAWLTWQTHAPARPAAPAAPAQAPVAGANWGGPQQPGVPPQQPGHGAAPQGQQPGGFAWSPGNVNEQTAYIPPQAPAGPQTLQAQQSPTGSYSVPGSMRPGQQQGVPPQQPQHPQQPGDARTQMMPPVPPTMHEYAPNPQPWQPGPGGATAAPQHNVPPQQQPAQPAENERNDGGAQGPFGVGNWQ